MFRKYHKTVSVTYLKTGDHSVIRYTNIIVYYGHPACQMRTLYFCPVVSIFFLSFSLPNLSGRRLDVYHTSTHDVALLRIYNACLKCAALGSLEIQDAKNRHLRTIAQRCWAIS